MQFRYWDREFFDLQLHIREDHVLTSGDEFLILQENGLFSQNYYCYNVFSELVKNHINALIFLGGAFEWTSSTYRNTMVKKWPSPKWWVCNFILFHTSIFFHLAINTVMNEKRHFFAKMGYKKSCLKLCWAIFKPTWECSCFLSNAKWINVGSSHKRECREKRLSSLNCVSSPKFFTGSFLMVTSPLFSKM